MRVEVAMAGGGVSHKWVWGKISGFKSVKQWVTKLRDLGFPPALLDGLNKQQLGEILYKHTNKNGKYIAVPFADPPLSS